MDLITLASPADAPRLQRLFERCSDYFELHEGCPPPADTGEYELAFVPPAGDLVVLALADDDGALHAMVQLLRDYPQRGLWWIALLVVAPELRGRGVGSALLRQATEMAAAQGGTAIRLAVSVRNPRGRRFWEAEGFRDEGRITDVTARSGHVDTVRILSRAVG